MKQNNKTFLGNATLFLFLFSFIPVHASLDRLSPAELNRQLLSAARDGECEEVERLLRAKANVNATDVHGETSLHKASSRGHETVVRMLLEKGANVHTLDGNGDTALYIASEMGFLGVVGILLETEADVNIADNIGRTALHGASYKGHANVVKLLLTAGADVHAVDTENDTPLMDAIGRHKIASAKLLVSYGADIDEEKLSNSKLSDNEKIAIRAAQKEFQDAVNHFLIQQGGMSKDVAYLTAIFFGGEQLLTGLKGSQAHAIML